jgi:hypothetical protein
MSQASTPPTTPPTTPGAIGKISPISKMAVSSLVCGICGLVIPLVNLVAIVLGAAALVKIKRSDGQKQGVGYATVGICLGAMGFLVTASVAYGLMGMAVAMRANTGWGVEPAMDRIFESMRNYALENGNYPDHAASIVVDTGGSVPLHHLVCTGLFVTNTDQATVGNYDFVNFDKSPTAVDEARQAIESVDRTAPFYKFGDCRFARLGAPRDDPNLVLAWCIVGTGPQPEWLVLFEDGEARRVAGEEWDSVWEADAEARSVIGLPATEPSDR